MNVAKAYDEVTQIFWDLMNTRDAMRHCEDPRLRLMAFRMNELLESVADVTDRLDKMEPEND